MSTTAIKELTGRVLEKRQKISVLMEKKNEKGEYNWNDQDREDFKSINAELAEIAPKLADLREKEKAAEENRKAMDELKSIANELPFAGELGHPDDGKKNRSGPSLTDLFLGSQSYKSWSRSPNEMIRAVGLKYSIDDFKAVMQETSNGYAPPNFRTPVVIYSAQRKPRVADLIPSSPTVNQIVKYMLETTFTNAAAATAESGSMPASTLIFTEVDVTVQAVTTYIAATNQQLKDVEDLRNIIDNRLMLMMEQSEENEILNGSGTSPHLAGLLNVSGINTQAKGGDDRPDAYLKAMTQVRFNTGTNAGFAEPTGIIAHPQDWMNVRLSKDALGNYLWGPPSQPGAMVIWGVPVIETPVIAQGTSLVGDFRSFAHISRRQDIDIEAGWINDDFIKGQNSIRAVSRLSLEVYRPAAFCTVTGL